MAHDGGSMAVTVVVGGGNKMCSLAGYTGIRNTCFPLRNQRVGNAYSMFITPERRTDRLVSHAHQQGGCHSSSKDYY
jgi:hypothetical protein